MTPIRAPSGYRVRTPVLVALALLAAPLPLVAQLVQGRLMDSTSGSPVRGALVLLLDATGAQAGGGLSGDDGVFRIRAPGLGRYSVRAERIGYETTTSEFFEVGAGFGVQLTLDLAPMAVALEGIRVDARRRCAVEPEEGRIVAWLWEEAKKVLRNQQWTESIGALRFRVGEYERRVDPKTGLVTAETLRFVNWVGRSPIRSLPPEDLLTGGFIRSDGKGGYEYFGPDAAVLLSDAFLDTHCFGLGTSASEPEAVGLTFEPLASRRGAADIKGTLWLGVVDARLRALDFTYTSSPWLEAIGVANGRVDFEELPEGAWIVRKWWIRMPRMTQAFELMQGGRSGLRVAGLVEAGGAVTRVDLIGGARAADAGTGRVSGIVWDSTRARPLAGADVYLTDGDRSAVSDADGRFTLDSVSAGMQGLAFRHPRLDSLSVSPPATEVTVATDATSEVTLSVPSLPSILGALCRGGDYALGSAAVVGIVRTPRDGGTLAGATVALEWTDYRVDGGREVLADVQTLRVATDEGGRYTACGIPPGVLLAARASTPVSTGGIRRVQVPRADVVVLDLGLESAPSIVEAEPAACPSSASSDSVGWVLGHVREKATGVVIGLSEIWLASDEQGRSASVRSDATGRFVFCDVEPGTYTVRAAVRGLGDARAALDVRAGRQTDAELLLRAEEATRATGTLKGRVVTAGDGRPLSGAEVRLRDNALRISGSDGSFAFPDVAAGTATVGVSYLGYAEARGEVVVGGGQTLTILVQMSEQPIELDPIVVEAVRFSGGGMLSDVRRRAGSAFGTVLMGETLDRKLRAATRTTDIMQDQGVTMVGNGRAFYFNRSQCAPHVYIDGVKVTHVPRGGGLDGARRGVDDPATVEAAGALNMVDPASIAAMEIYRSPAETPGEFIDSDSQCGVILIWTRRGDDVGR